MQRNTTAKYKVLRDELLRAIRAGELRAGQRLPAERELASRFEVTHMTVRQAVAELVDFELLERRSRMGIYVRDNSQEKLTTTTLNLICPVSDSTSTSDFLKFGMRQAEQRGWRTRITRSWQGYEDPLVRALGAGEPSLIFLNFPYMSQNMRNAMIQSNGRAIMIGARFDDHGVPSVLADDKLAMEMAVSHLREAGHVNIALLVNGPDHPIAQVQLGAWRECFHGLVPDEVLDRRLIVTPEISDFQSSAEAGYEAVAAWLKRPDADATAMICLNDMTTYGAIFACREMGRIVPEDMSLICTFDSYVLKFMEQGITVVDICMEQHVTAAMKMVDASMTGSLPPDDRLHFVQPRLVRRNSVQRRLSSGAVPPGGPNWGNSGEERKKNGRKCLTRELPGYNISTPAL